MGTPILRRHLPYLGPRKTKEQRLMKECYAYVHWKGLTDIIKCLPALWFEFSCAILPPFLPSLCKSWYTAYGYSLFRVENLSCVSFRFLAWSTTFFLFFLSFFLSFFGGGGGGGGGGLYCGNKYHMNPGHIVASLFSFSPPLEIDMGHWALASLISQIRKSNK